MVVSHYSRWYRNSAKLGVVGGVGGLLGVCGRSPFGSYNFCMCRRVDACGENHGCIRLDPNSIINVYLDTHTRLT